MIGKLLARRSGEGTSLDDQRKVKAFAFHVNAYQRVTSAEKDFSNQVDRLTFSVDTNHSLPQSPYFCPRVRDEGQAWVQEHGLPLTKANVATTTAEWPV